MRVVFCGGGTGGHVYPALTVARALRELSESQAIDERPDILYVGVRGKIDEELVRREGIDFKAVTARPLRTGTLPGTAKGAASLAAGTAEAARILRAFRPDVVFATGGYGSVGVGFAAKLLKRPLLVFLPDVEAGMAVKALARVAGRIAVTVEAALASVPRDKAVVTGYPVRPEFFSVDREGARTRLGLDPALPVLLVSGASTGANRLNKAIAALAPKFLESGQLLHLCGRGDESWLRSECARLPPDLAARWRLHAYLHEDMAPAMAAADLAVMRSGGSTLGELPATRLPAVLVPGEYEGWDQSPNARYLESEGAAVMLPQARLEHALEHEVTALLGDAPRLQRMRDSLARLARPDAAANLARLVTEMAGAHEAVPA
jgi:UDP-N-acetylglucosamine--N-acetylmuramyl-(pentapeptide) pyrophosphoryl-undecaprenol N-acetylglucosamine transferase